MDGKTLRRGEGDEDGAAERLNRVMLRYVGRVMGSGLIAVGVARAL